MKKSETNLYSTQHAHTKGPQSPSLPKNSKGIHLLGESGREIHSNQIIASLWSSAELTGTMGGSVDDASSRWICAKSLMIPVLSL